MCPLYERITYYFSTPRQLLNIMPRAPWDPASDPPTKLGRHRRLAPLAGVHVSPIALGAMSIGDKWAQWGHGTMDKDSSFKLLNAFYDAGGNFIDTSNNYQDETSEMFIGEWMEQRGIRDQMVIATKVGFRIFLTANKGILTSDMIHAVHNQLEDL